MNLSKQHYCHLCPMPVLHLQGRLAHQEPLARLSAPDVPVIFRKIDPSVIPETSEVEVLFQMVAVLPDSSIIEPYRSVESGVKPDTSRLDKSSNTSLESSGLIVVFVTTSLTPTYFAQACSADATSPIAAIKPWGGICADLRKVWRKFGRFCVSEAAKLE